MLERYGLVERVCTGAERKYRDVLIRRKDYMFTDTDKLFIDELTKAKRKFSDMSK